MKKIRILFFAVVVFLLSAASFAYGETVFLEDDQIQIDVPQGWSDVPEETYSDLIPSYVEQEDFDPENAEDYGLLMVRHKAFSEGGSQRDVTMELLYLEDYEGQVNYDECSEEQLESYYLDYSEAVMDRMLPQTTNTRSWSYAFQTVEGEWGPFLIQDMQEESDDGKKINYHLYYTVKEGCIVGFLLTSAGGQMPEQAVSEGDETVISFVDEGYYENYVGVYEDDDEYEEPGFDSIEGGSFLAEILIVLVVAGIGGLVSMAKRSETRSGSHAFGSLKKKSSVQEKSTAAPQKIRTEEKPLKRSSAQTADADKNYIESLKTMVKSGLLTKEQYQEMVEKHRKK